MPLRMLCALVCPLALPQLPTRWLPAWLTGPPPHAVTLLNRPIWLCIQAIVGEGQAVMVPGRVSDEGLTGDWGPGSCDWTATALAPFSTTPFACAASLTIECALFTPSATGTALSLYL